MDTLDRHIIKSLQSDGRKPFTKIAASLGVSEGTIRKRFARLVENETVQIIGRVNPLNAGSDAPAMIGVSFLPLELEPAIEKILQFPEVAHMVLVSGKYDLFVEVLCENRQHLTYFLNQCLRKVPGVEKVQTFQILHTYSVTNSGKPTAPTFE